MKKIFFLLFIFICKTTFCQDEATKSDLKSCLNFYYTSADIQKQLKQKNDTLRYFHDGELILFFNQKETKRLSKNTFYLLNHGFNKLISMRILLIEIEASNTKKDKKTFVTSANSYFDVYYKDSLAKCGQMIAGPLSLNVFGYKKNEITGIFVEIEYYNEHIYKWFLKEIDIPENLVDVRWQIKN